MSKSSSDETLPLSSTGVSPHPLTKTGAAFFAKVHGKKRGRKPARLAYCLWLMCEAMGEQDFLTAEDKLFIRFEIEDLI